MITSIQDLQGMPCIVIETDEGGEVIPLQAIASWGVLLGLTDTQEILKAIREHQATPVDPGQPNEWTPLYDALQSGLDEMAKAGVPAEFMVELLDPELGAPIPGVEAMASIAAAQSECPMMSVIKPEPVMRVASFAMATEPEIDPALLSIIETVNSEWSTRIAQDRVDFIDQLVKPVIMQPTPEEGATSE